MANPYYVPRDNTNFANILSVIKLGLDAYNTYQQGNLSQQHEDLAREDYMLRKQTAEDTKGFNQQRLGLQQEEIDVRGRQAAVAERGIAQKERQAPEHLKQWGKLESEVTKNYLTKFGVKDKDKELFPLLDKMAKDPSVTKGQAWRIVKRDANRIKGIALNEAVETYISKSKDEEYEASREGRELYAFIMKLENDTENKWVDELFTKTIKSETDAAKKAEKEAYIPPESLKPIVGPDGKIIYGRPTEGTLVPPKGDTWSTPVPGPTGLREQRSTSGQLRVIDKEGSQTEEQLTRTSLYDSDPQKRDQAKGILKAMQQRKIDLAKEKGNAGAIADIGTVPTTPPGVKNEAALQGLKPGEAAVVKGLAEYRIKLPSGMALRTPYWQGILQRAALYDSSFDAAQYSVRLSLRRDFTSGNASKNVRSLNTAVGHLESLSKAAKELDNADIQLWNTIANKGFTATGDPRVTNFNTAATAVAGELATVFKNTSGTDQEIKSWRDNISSSQSPQQMKESIDTAIELLGGRLAALSNQYETGMGKPKDYRFLSPKSLKILKSLNVDIDSIDPMAGEKGASPLTGKRDLDKYWK